MIAIGLNDHVLWALGTLLKELQSVESISSMNVGALCQCDSWSLATAQSAAICLFPPEFVLKAFTERVINHSMLHMIAEVFFRYFFLILCQIQNQGNQEKSFNLICFELKQRIEDFMFSLSKSNCKLMWTSQLPSPRRRSGSSNDSVPWSSACVNHPDCSSL